MTNIKMEDIIVKKKGKLLKVILIITVVLIALISYMSIRYKGMVKTFYSTTINNIDLSKVKDGVYSSSYVNFLIRVDLKVTVKNHKITDIKIIKQSCGKGYEATDTVTKVLKAQSLKVDTVTGATGSSMAILKAIEQALTQ